MALGRQGNMIESPSNVARLIPQETMMTTIDTAVLYFGSPDAQGNAKGVRFTVSGFAPFDVLFADLTATVMAEAIAQGIRKKVGDGAALAKGATNKDKHDAMKAIADRIIGPSGEWNARGEGAGGSIGLLEAALVRMGHAQAAVDALLASISDKEKSALRADATIAPAIEAIKAERAAKRPDVKAVDTAGLLAKLRPVVVTPVTARVETPVAISIEGALSKPVKAKPVAVK